MGDRYQLFSNDREEDFYVEGVIILDDLETCVNIKGSSVVVFDDSAKSNKEIGRSRERRRCSDSI